MARTSGCRCRTTRTSVSSRSTSAPSGAGAASARHSTTSASARLRAADRTTVLGEAYEPVDGEPTASVAFAESLGFTSEHVEEHLVLPLPVPAAQVERLRASLPDLVGYELVTWGDHCPEEHLAAYCSMMTQMDADVPTGELDLEPVVFDEARVRTSEERLARSHEQLHVAARRLDRRGVRRVLHRAAAQGRGARPPVRHPGHAGAPRAPARPPHEARHPGPGPGRATPSAPPSTRGPRGPTRRCRRPTSGSGTP